MAELNKTGDNQEKEDEDSVPKTASEAFDSILSSVGDDGKWQWKVTFWAGLIGIVTAMNNQGAVFLAATPNHWCDISNTSKYTDTDINPALYEEIRNFSTPRVIGKEGDLIPDKCNYIDRESRLDEMFQNSSGNSWSSSTSLPFHSSDQISENITEKIECSKWEYDNSTFHSTVVTEWNLVCDDHWIKPTIQATFMMGFLIGSFVASAFSDRFGRRPSTLCCTLLLIASSIVAAFSPSLWFFMLFRFIIAGAGQGVYLINFVIVMEVCGRKTRNILGMINAYYYAIGTILLASFSYFVKDWRSLQLMNSAFGLILISFYWVIPESPRWLLMNGRTEEGLAALKQIGKVNGGKELLEEEKLNFALKIIDKEVQLQREKMGESFSSQLLEFYRNTSMLFRTPNMRRRSLIMCYCWFVVAMSVYGVIFSGENINISSHALTLYGGLIIFPYCIVCYFSFERIGRRLTLTYSLLLGGLGCIAILFIPTRISWLKLLSLLVVRFFLGITFRCVYYLSTELAPTQIRNNSIGVGSMVGRIGSGLAPYIVDLLGEIYYAIPTTIFGLLAIIAGFLALLLPETSHHPLPESIEEIEKLPK